MECTNGKLPSFARFRPKDEYVSTFDMLHDKARNQAYSRAVRLHATNPGDDRAAPEGIIRWLDIGTGSGLLASLVAAAAAPSPAPASPSPTRAEATPASAATAAATPTTEVYACEGVAEVADVAAETFAKNGGDVRLFRGHSTEMEVGRDLPSRVPRVISELLGTGLLEEGILPTLRDAQARLLLPGYVSIPHSAEVWALCCESLELHNMSRLLPPTTESSSGKAIFPPSSENWKRCPGTAAPTSVRSRFRPLSPSVRAFDFDFSALDRPLPGPEGRRREVRFPIDNGGGTVHAVICWWRCFMDEGRTISMSTSPLDEGASPAGEGPVPAAQAPRRDHWRHSVYLLGRPVAVQAGDIVRALACHDDTSIWLDAVERDEAPGDSDGGGVARASIRGVPSSSEGSGSANAAASVATTTPASRGAAPESKEAGAAQQLQREAGEEREDEEEAEEEEDQVRAPEEPESGPFFPPVCVCGLHRTCPPSQIWMLNDQDRTAAFRSAIRSIIAGDSSPSLGITTGEARQEIATAAPAGGAKRKRTAVTRVACVSDGFLLPLLAAQEGATEVFEIQPSTAFGVVCRDVYRANGIDVANHGDGDSDDRPNRRVIRPFPGGVSSVYDLMLPSPGPSSAATDDDKGSGSGFAGEKLDAVIGEPFFEGLSTAAWPLESLLLFWCARTALEARGWFSPRTRVLPARARLLACPLSCDLLFQGRRKVGDVEGVDMSAVNYSLGVGRPQGAACGPDDGGGSGGGMGDEGGGGRRPASDVESVRLSEFGHELLGPPAAMLDMDLTRPLCDLRGGREELRCLGCRQQHGRGGSGRREAGRAVVCHGVALWLEIWLDEEGLHRLSTGPEAGYWPQGVVFFEEGWVVPAAGGGSFHLEATLDNGALGVCVS